MGGEKAAESGGPGLRRGRGPGAGGEARARVLTRAEDLIYMAVAASLAALALAVLGAGIGEFVRDTRESGLRQAGLKLLDATLLVLMLVEILHTVGISLKEHHIVPEPFLIVGLIAAIRRVLVITAEQGTPTAEKAVAFRLAMLEMGILTGLILALVAGLIALARSRERPKIERGTGAGDGERPPGERPGRSGEVPRELADREE